MQRNGKYMRKKWYILFLRQRIFSLKLQKIWIIYENFTPDSQKKTSKCCKKNYQSVSYDLSSAPALLEVAHTCLLHCAAHTGLLHCATHTGISGRSVPMSVGLVPSVAAERPRQNIFWNRSIEVLWPSKLKCLLVL